MPYSYVAYRIFFLLHSFLMYTNVPPPLQHTTQPNTAAMDAIKKKMQSLKAETDQLKAIIQNFEDETRYHIARAEQADTDIRDYGKKCAKLEFEFDETND